VLLRMDHLLEYIYIQCREATGLVIVMPGYIGAVTSVTCAASEWTIHSQSAEVTHMSVHATHHNCFRTISWNFEAKLYSLSRLTR
jgi:hypothetical protein